jgi:hypothetical protein
MRRPGAMSCSWLKGALIGSSSSSALEQIALETNASR